MTICEHIKDNGSTCGSPALKGEVFCYFHQRLRLPRHRPGDFEYKLPILDNPESILMAIQHITQAALDGTLEDRRARLVLSALRLAQTTLKQMKKEDDLKMNTEGKSDPLDAARPRAASTTTEGEPSAHPANAMQNVDTTAEEQPAAAAAPEGSPGREPWVSVTSAPKAPAGATDKLSAHQSKLLKKILRRGPKHPQFHLAARLLDHDIAGAS